MGSPALIRQRENIAVMSEQGSKVAHSVIEGVVRDHNFVGEMNPSLLMVAPQRSLLQAPLTHAIRSKAGCASTGVLAALTDVSTSDPALATARPGWTATQDLSTYGAAPLVDGPILVDSQIVRAGKKMIVVSADIYDTHGETDFPTIQARIDVRSDPSQPTDPALTLAGSGLVTFARIPGEAAAGLEHYHPGEWIGQIRHRLVDTPASGTVYDRMGLVVVDAPAGQVELERTPYVANTIGTINGGAQAMLINFAAETMRPGQRTADMQIHYLSQLKVGPARTHGTLVREAAQHSVVTIRLVDAGNHDRLLALATVTLRDY
jgi:acyl-coenzyme A thioesterase PaaI-like protein